MGHVQVRHRNLAYCLLKFDKQSFKEAIARLPTSDASLIEEIFWEGKSEARLAEALGISQQAVNKRKHNIFRLLDNIIRTRFPQIAPGADSEAPIH